MHLYSFIFSENNKKLEQRFLLSVCIVSLNLKAHGPIANMVYTEDSYFDFCNHLEPLGSQIDHYGQPELHSWPWGQRHIKPPKLLDP